MSVASNATEPICFVIGRPRSGTTVLKRMLRTHPKIFSCDEIFHEKNPVSYWRFLQQKIATDPSALLPSASSDNFIEYIEWCKGMAAKDKPSAELLIFDMKYDQSHLVYDAWQAVGTLPRIFRMMKERNWRVIDVHRRDLIGMVVSNEIAIQTGVYHIAAEDDLAPTSRTKRTPQPKIRLNPAALVREIELTIKAYRAVEDYFSDCSNYIQVNYEEMFDEAEGGMFSWRFVDNVSSFLGLNNAFRRDPKLQKLFKGDPFARIENVEEIRRTLNLQVGQLLNLHQLEHVSVYLGDKALPVEASIDDSEVRLRVAGVSDHLADSSRVSVRLLLPFNYRSAAVSDTDLALLVDKVFVKAIDPKLLGTGEWWSDPGRREPRFSGVVGGRLATAGAMKLDEIKAGNDHRHLDVSAFDVALDGETWRSVKFKFCLTSSDRFLEFREMSNWPTMFTEFPTGQRDAYGPVWWMSIRDIPAVSVWRSERDQLLLQSIVALLPKIIEEAVAVDEFSPEDRRMWCEEAANLAVSYMRAMRDHEVGVFAGQRPDRVL